jgi:hypothetical protein
MKILILAACFVLFGATLASAQAPSAPPQKDSAPPQKDVDHCRSLPFSQQWGCFRDLETRLKSAAVPQPAPAPAQQTQQKPAAPIPPTPRPAGGSEELRD